MININENASTKITRKTMGVCDVCGEKVQAYITETDKDIFFCKSCVNHGDKQVRISRKKYYNDLEQFYFPLIEKKPQCSVEMVELVVTFKCNISCPICYLGDFKKKLNDFDPTLEEINDFAKGCSYPALVISGGEATCREDLPEIIAILKRYGKTVSLNTNGIKLADFNYALKLKTAGIDRINIQFTGFDREAEKALRGADYNPAKLKAIKNLEKLKISTGLNALIVGEVNEEQIGGIIDFGVKSEFVKMVNLSVLIFVGYTKNYPQSNYLMPDDIIQLAEKQTKGMIVTQNVYIFKKLEIVVSSFLNKNTCLYHQGYLLVVKGGAAEPIDAYINLRKIEPYLNMYQKIYLQNILFAKLYLLLVFPIALLINAKFFKICGNLFNYVFSYFFNRKYFLESSLLKTIVFSVECDNYRKDYAMYGKNCPCKAVFFVKRNGTNFEKHAQPVEDTYWFLWR
ncbi:MAG: radical SAM protein [Candidatus Omnitrophota bacterium]